MGKARCPPEAIFARMEDGQALHGYGHQNVLRKMGFVQPDPPAFFNHEIHD